MCHDMRSKGESKATESVGTLQAVNDAAANPSSESMPIIGMGAEYPQLLEVTEGLNENVAQLHRSVCLFMGQAWKKASPIVSFAMYIVREDTYSCHYVKGEACASRN